MTERTERISANDAAADLGTELMLLIEMIVEHAAPWLDGLIAAGHTGGLFGGGASGTPDDTGDSGGGASSEHANAQYNCGWCPLCAVVSMARGDRPEFSSRAVEQLAQLVGVLRAVLADRWYPGEGIHMPGAPRAERQDTGPAWTDGPRTRPSAPQAAAAGRSTAGGTAAGRSDAGRPAGASRAQHITVRKTGSSGSADPAGSAESSWSAEPGETF
ncbi:hypothetical protein [Haloechinothrix halophila]|uniref:hypothetical protein n=1 Tax=Haloechinothrix halophila TaxID=1069073 RepID=UPI000408806E|nr:hypothetical protein [Haloechinothrix halophila]